MELICTQFIAISRPARMVASTRQTRTYLPQAGIRGVVRVAVHCKAIIRSLAQTTKPTSAALSHTSIRIAAALVRHDALAACLVPSILQERSNHDACEDPIRSEECAGFIPWSTKKRCSDRCGQFRKRNLRSHLKGSCRHKCSWVLFHLREMCRRSRTRPTRRARRQQTQIVTLLRSGRCIVYLCFKATHGIIRVNALTREIQ
jgi:hypothetical protein